LCADPRRGCRSGGVPSAGASTRCHLVGRLGGRGRRARGQGSSRSQSRRRAVTRSGSSSGR
jgi:hypothetical protein